MERVYTVADIMEHTGYSRGYVWLLIRLERIPYEKHGPRTAIIREKVFNQFFKNRKKGAPHKP